MDKEKLERYALKKIQISELEDELDAMKPEIIEIMQAAQADKIKMDLGSFTLEQKRTWTYSDTYESKKVELKELEAEEKADGTATYEENPTLKFTQKKDKKNLLD